MVMGYLQQCVSNKGRLRKVKKCPNVGSVTQRKGLHMLDGRKSFYAIVGVVTAFFFTTSAAAHTMIVVPELDATKSNIVFQILDHNEQHSSIIRSTTNEGKERICKSFSDPRCSSLEEYKVEIILPPCSAKSTNLDYCIRGLDITGNDGKMIATSLVREVQTPRIAANLSAKIGTGGGISIWKIAPGKSSDPASNVAIEISLTYLVTKNLKTKNLNPAQLADIKIAVYPVQFRTGAFEPLDYLINNEGSDVLGVNPASQKIDDSSQCHWTEKGVCALQGHFHADTNVAISVQMDNKLRGWLSSQILDLKIQEKKISPITNLLEISGRASKSSPVYAIDNISDISKMNELRAAYNRCGNDVLVCPQAYEQYDNIIWEGILTDNTKDSQFNFGLADVISASLTDIEGVDSQWKLSSMPQAHWRKGVSWSPCVSNSKVLAGVVSTNASLYQMNPPELVDQKLVSRVEGAHHNSKHELNKVDYQVAMRGDVLRCLLKKNTNPTSVKATAFSSAGEVMENPAVQMVEQNGWVNFAAKNFSYSTPNVEFVFSTPVVKTVSKTISCAKGKKIVKVKAAAPKCPKGYKKV